jgi:hypothetical protein
VIADPAGTLDSGSWNAWFSMPEEVVAIYNAVGGAPVDPSTHHIARSTEPVVVDPELALHLLKQAPPQGRRIAECMIDLRVNRQFCVPGRDPITGAPYTLNLIHEYCTPCAFAGAMAANLTELRRTTTLFWDCVQQAGLLSDAPRLSPRPR